MRSNMFCYLRGLVRRLKFSYQNFLTCLTISHENEKKLNNENSKERNGREEIFFKKIEQI